MSKRKVLSSMVGVSLAAAILLASCASAPITAAPAPATTVVPASATVILTASPVPVVATATATAVPVATDTPLPSATATQAPTAASNPTTTSLTAQVIPSINAYCRKGPGTGYFAITNLNKGTTYNVIGRNSLSTWWQVRASANVTCWMGDPNATTQGSVQQVPVAQVTPLPLTPSLFVNSNTCNTTSHTLKVSFNWAAVQNVTGYRIYRNGDQLIELGPDATSYGDTDAPTGQVLVYELEAFNDYGVAPRISTNVAACD